MFFVFGERMMFSFQSVRKITMAWHQAGDLIRVKTANKVRTKKGYVT